MRFTDARAGIRRRMDQLPVVSTLAELAELLDSGMKVYLRYSGGPDVDREETSRDYESGLTLPGLSTLDLDPPSWWTRPATDWLARQINKYGHLAEQDEDRHAWLLTGREVGRGPDNEPLIAEFTPLARLGRSALAEAEECYRERFQVGRSGA